MNKTGAFFLGFGCAIGCIFLMSLLLSFCTNNTSDNSKQTNYQYTEIKTPDGYVTLHSDMPKDSVKIVLGKPDQTLMREIYRDNYEEEWEYFFKKGSLYEHMPSLTLEFENGKLKKIKER